MIAFLLLLTAPLLSVNTPTPSAQNRAAVSAPSVAVGSGFCPALVNGRDQQGDALVSCDAPRNGGREQASSERTGSSGASRQKGATPARPGGAPLKPGRTGAGAFSRWYTCRVSTFGGKHDKMRGGRSPCLGRKVRSTDIGIAVRAVRGSHKKRCARRYELYNPRTKLAIVVPLIDFGPWWAVRKDCKRNCRLRKNGARTMLRLKATHTYADNCADSTEATLRAIGAGAFDRLRLRRIN